MLGNKINGLTIATLVGMFLSAIFYAKHDVTFNIVGYAWLCVNIISTSIYQVYIRAISYKPRPNVLNRGHPIWLVLIYVVEGGVLRILTQAAPKNIEPFSFYERFSEATLVDPLFRGTIFMSSYIENS